MRENSNKSETTSGGELYDRLGQKYSDVAADYLAKGLDAGRTFIDERLGDVDGVRLLEIGCGSGVDVARYEERGAEAYGVDPSQAMITDAKKIVENPGRITIGEYARIPFPTAFFDVVTARFSLHYVTDVAAAWKEVARVLKPGGKLVLLVSHPDLDNSEKDHHFQKEGRTYVRTTLHKGTVTIEYPLHPKDEYLSDDFYAYFATPAEVFEYKGGERDSNAPLDSMGISAVRK